MILAWDEEAWDDYCYWQEQDKKTQQRINKLLADIRRNGYNGIGNPEPLKFDLKNYRSRRIDKKIVSYIKLKMTLYLLFNADLITEINRGNSKS